MCGLRPAQRAAGQHHFVPPQEGPHEAHVDDHRS